MEHLTADLMWLADHLGVEKAVWAGHDWGGIVGWQIPLRYPERVAGMIGLNTPFMPRPPIDPIAFFRQRFGEEMYIVDFQTAGRADEILARDPDKTMRFFMRLPPVLKEEHFSTQTPAGKSRFALIKVLETYTPDADGRGEFLTPEELSVFVETFRASGFTGGINWYRNFTRNWQRSADIVQKVTQPSLMISAENDAVLPPSMCDGMEAWVPDLEKLVIKGSGHWTQQEKPDEVNAAIIDWLDRRFPQTSA